MNYLTAYEVSQILQKHFPGHDTTPATDAIIRAESAKQPRHTDWWVMVVKSEDQFIPVGCVQEGDETFMESWYPEFNVILPIPDPNDERLREFDGF